MQHTDHYGLFWEGPVAWLLQGRGGNNFAGLKAQCPYRAPKGMCNHLIPVAAPIPDRIHWEKFLGIINDPLVQALLPIPQPAGKNSFYVDDPYGDLAYYLSNLSRLSSPIQPIVRPAWSLKARDLERELSTTNVQPLIVVKTEPGDQAIVDTIGELSTFTPRTVVLTGSDAVVVQPPMQRIRTEIRNHGLEDIMTLPLENLGAAVIRRVARREQVDAPMLSRQDRREKQIRDRMNKG